MQFAGSRWEGNLPAASPLTYGYGSPLGNGVVKETDGFWKRQDVLGGGVIGSRERVPNIRPQGQGVAFDVRHTLASYHDEQPALLPPLAHLHSLDQYSTSNTLWWGDLEPWMDEEYAKQVCALMGWDAASNNGDGVTVKIPQPQDGAGFPNHVNNPGYCLLTFPNYQQAANVLAKLRDGTAKTPTMPNSSRPFNLNWASVVAPASVPQVQNTTTTDIPPQPKPQPLVKEYSIFVGDLAPEASNSDLLAVFRNPILGLRSDRAPKCVRPFYTCKSAKIMLDPTTGISKGYGFVRYVLYAVLFAATNYLTLFLSFTDQAEQQRALIEMHGLYCLSRPSESREVLS